MPDFRGQSATIAGAFAINEFAGFFDDAALFPPGNAPMSRGVPEHRARRAASTGAAVGPFIIAAPSLDELSTVLNAQPDPAQPIEVGLVVPGGADGVFAALNNASADGRITVRAVEVAMLHHTTPEAELDGLISVLAQSLPAGAQAFIETGYRTEVLDQFDRLQGSGYAIKFRCGGLSAELFPTTGQLAAGIATTLQAGVAFKCTAGLHQAVRHTAAGTGFEQFGFLNILLAAAAAETTDAAGLATLLDDRDRLGVANQIRGLGSMGLAKARRHFLSYGTCDIAEPLADLRDLGLLEPPLAAEHQLSSPQRTEIA